MNKKRFTQLLTLLCGLLPFMLTAQSSQVPCETISIQTIDNELVISNLNVANTKIRVFDPNYNLVFSCEFDCTANIDIADANDGETYHLTLEFFSDNFSYLLQEKIDYTIGATAVEIGICTGNVTLLDQSEVDAFCGCEIITGQLDIGDRFSDANDIDNISNLTGIKVVEDLVVKGSNLTSLAALENVKIARGIGVFTNPLLASLDAFNQIEVIQDVQITNNSGLRQLNAFQQLKEVQLVLALNSNSQLTTLNGLGNLEIVNGFSFQNNDAFEVLDELVSLRTADRYLSIRLNDQLKEIVFSELSGNVDEVLIADNPLLASLPAIGGLSIAQALQILDNPSLDECCALATLIDADLSNGHNGGLLNLRDNGAMCNSSLDILENCGGTAPANCEDITISSTNNQLIINNLNAPISIVKVFDESYQLIFDCNNNCDAEIIIPDLATCENYIIDVQLYGENYELICERKFNQVVQGQSAATAICNGTVVLNSQEDVDNFCGCTKIEGSLLIGNSQANDINDLSNLSVLKEVTELIYIRNTQLREISNLNIQKVGSSFRIADNFILNRIDGFNEMEFSQALAIENNTNLKTIDGFNQADNIENLFIKNNVNLLEIQGFDELVDAFFIDIAGNDALKEVRFDVLKSSSAQVFIARNDALETIAFPQLNTTAILKISDNPNLTTVSNFDNLVISFSLEIKDNPALTDCCFLKPLVDDDYSNGNVNGQTVIQNNGALCNSEAEILENCSGNPPGNPCDELSITSDNNSLTISNLNTPNTIVKVFDNNWSFAFNCQADCDQTILLDNLTAGDTYHTDIQFYDANWQFICADKQDIMIEGGTSTNPCSNITVETDINFRSITVANLTAPIQIVKIFNENWQILYECFADCEDQIEILELSGSLYHLQVDMYDENWTPICNLEEDITFSNSSESRTNDLQAADFMLHPNPALEETIINLQQLEGEAVTLKLFNQFGQEVYLKSIDKVTESKELINLTSFSNGLYILQIQPKGRRAISKRLVVNRLY